MKSVHFGAVPFSTVQEAQGKETKFKYRDSVGEERVCTVTGGLKLYDCPPLDIMDTSDAYEMGINLEKPFQAYGITLTNVKNGVPTNTILVVQDDEQGVPQVPHMDLIG